MARVAPACGMGDDSATPLEPIAAGQRVVVKTPDRREWRGRIVNIRTGEPGRRRIVVRLDTGWETSYPEQLVFPLEE